jgi:hypothetical protein
MATGTVQMDGFPAFDIVMLKAITNGDVYQSKLSYVYGAQVTMRDAVYTHGTANTITTGISGSAITINTRGFVSGTADLIAYGRL